MTYRTIVSTAYGRRVGLRLPADDERSIRPSLPHWWRDDDGSEPERTWTVEAPDQAAGVIGEVELWVAEHAENLIFVHAGAVAVNGRALLLPGRSFSGKTTLTAALLRTGADYGSDEYAVLDGQGRVHTYPRALSMRTPTGRPRVRPAELGAQIFDGPLPIAAIAVLQYRPGGNFAVRPISQATAILRLFDNTVCALSRPQAALDALIAATAGAYCIEGTRGSASDIAALVLDMVGANA